MFRFYQGWAIKRGKSQNLKSEVISFMKEYFWRMRTDGHRANAEESYRLVREEKNGELFSFQLVDCPSEIAYYLTLGDGRMLVIKVTYNVLDMC